MRFGRRNPSKLRTGATVLASAAVLAALAACTADPAPATGNTPTATP